MKDTKLHQSESADSVRVKGEMQARQAGGDIAPQRWGDIAPQRWGDRHKRPVLSPISPIKDQAIDKDKEYTNINKKAKYICGVVCGLMSGLGASWMDRAVWSNGCNCLAAMVPSLLLIQKSRLSTRAIARTSRWSAPS